MEKNLRCGYTTGSCAAAAAKAACRMLLMQRALYTVRLTVPAGSTLNLELEDVSLNKDSACCAVRKDSGDDPDVTGGILVYAEVSLDHKSEAVEIRGGKGIGIVTRPGLDQPVGSHAINTIPRRMIREAVSGELREHGITCGAVVTISIPDGEKLAAKTFNPRLGITGGISVLGTTGIVRPMSDEAVMDTIKAEIRIRKAESWPVLPVVPGNYGETFLERHYGIPAGSPVTCSNFARHSMQMASAYGFTRILFAGHMGKLVKIAAGVPNTHSRYGDGRMESIIRSYREVTGMQDPSTEERILRAVSTEEALCILEESGIMERVAAKLLDSARKHLVRWSGADVQVVMFRNGYIPVAASSGSDEYADCIRRFTLKERSVQPQSGGAL